MSPEIVSKTEYVGQKADSWALGILLYVMVCGNFPFKGINDAELFKKIKRCKFDIPQSLNEDLRKLITKILNVYPNERPLPSEVNFIIINFGNK